MKFLIEAAMILAGFHLALGIVFAALFHWRGIARLDAAAAAAGVGFRLIITPGVIILWPLLAGRWWRLSRGGSFLGEPETPLSPRRLRAGHRLAWRALALVIPLAIAAALWWRPWY